MLITQIKADLKQSIKEKDTAKKSTLRMLLAKLEKEKVAKKLTDVSELTNKQVQSVISKNVKELDKEIESYVAVERDTTSQEAEKQLLMDYLPKQLSEEETKAVVIEVSNATKISGGNIGMAMKELSARLKGKADMSLVNKLTKNEFNAE